MIQPGLSTIALDIGSESIQGAVLDLEAGSLISHSSRTFPGPLENLPQGYVEIDPKLVVARVLDLIDELSQPLSQYCSVWICGQMGGVILADDRGRARSNYLSSTDQRTLKSANGVRPSMETIRLDWPEAVFASLGRELLAGSTATLLHWLSEHRKLSDGVLPLSIADYCISHLARQPGTTHSTQAIGLLDLNKFDWHYGAMERIGLGDLWWPELVRSTQAVAKWKIGTRTFHVHGSYGDQQCSLVAAGLGPGELSIHHQANNSRLSVLADSFQSGPYQTRAYFGDRWLNTITHLPEAPELNADCDTMAEHYFRVARRFGENRPWSSMVLSGSDLARRPAVVPALQERFRVPTREVPADGVHADQWESQQTLLGLLRLAQEHSFGRKLG